MAELRELEEIIRKSFQKSEKEFEEYNIKVANKAFDMLKDTESLVNNCNPKSVSKISNTKVYIEKHPDDLLELYNNMSSMIFTLEKKFENECTCMMK